MGIFWFTISGETAMSDVSTHERDLRTAGVSDESGQGGNGAESRDHMTIISQCKFIYIRK